VLLSVHIELSSPRGGFFCLFSISTLFFSCFTALPSPTPAAPDGDWVAFFPDYQCAATFFSNVKRRLRLPFDRLPPSSLNFLRFFYFQCDMQVQDDTTDD